MTPVLLFLASIVAGAINSIAGGGTLLTFPALLAFLSPVEANTTCTIAMLPGTLASAFALREQIAPVRHAATRLAAVSIVGGIVGAILLTWLPAEVFRGLIPWFLLLAAILFSLRPLLVRRAGGAATAGEPPLPVWLLPVQFLIGVYGGYFGAAIGIMMLGAFAAAGMRDVHRMNALKSALAAMMNIVAAAIFIAQGHVAWKYAMLMAAGATLGGYFGARSALRVNRKIIEILITVIAYALTAYFFLR